MLFLLQNNYRDWKSYFDYIVVDGCKPVFFSDGTIMRQVNTETGALKLGTHTGELVQGHIYSGGSLLFSSLVQYMTDEFSSPAF